MIKSDRILGITTLLLFSSSILFSAPDFSATKANHFFRIDAAIEPWTDTGVEINQGEEYIFWATGSFHMHTPDLHLYATHWLTPNGTLREITEDFDLGTLIAKIGSEGEAFPIRDFFTFKAEVTGRLFLKLYDSPGMYYNNEGFANVLVYGPIQRPMNTNVMNNLGSGAIKPITVSQNYPNPFNPSCTIDFEIQQADDVKISIFNSLGQKVKTLVNEYRTPGEYSTIWNGTDDNENILSSGQYYYKLEVGEFSSSRKMILLK